MTDSVRAAGGAGSRYVPRWGVAAAAAAPALLAGGLLAAAALQPPGFAAFSGTVSSLAGQDAAHSWIMTLTFAVVGACEATTALALRPAAAPGRVMLAGAGVTGPLVAAFPVHLGGSRAHALWAGIGFAGLILWPVFAMRRRADGVPWALRPAACILVTVTLSALTLWFAAEQATSGAAMGVAERAAGVAQTSWPLVVVLSCRRAAGGELAAATAGPAGPAGPAADPGPGVTRS